MKTYPLFLVKLDRARCVVVGGGPVAARKAAGLRRAGARLVIISPCLSQQLEELARRGEVEVVRRAYRPGDLDEAFLVVAATDDSEVNREVWQEARERDLLINVVDDPEHCNFIAPSVIRRGALTLAISTSGECPALSRHLRQELETAFGPAYAEYVALLGELRDGLIEALSLEERRDFWQEIFESDVLSLLASGEQGTARRRAEVIRRQYLPGEA